MTNPGSSPESRKERLKSLIVKGIAGTVALIGTTGIPILVKQSLEKPTGSAISPSTPATVGTPIPFTPSAPDPSSPAQLQPTMEGAVAGPDDRDVPGGKHKTKKKKGEKE